MQKETALFGAVQNLYEIFGRHPLLKHVDGCPGCVHESDQRALESKPLRLLSPAELGPYAFKAMTTWGGKDDFRHFLPRIFELLVTKEGIGCDEEVILGKLALADWKQWPDQEQSALRDYFRAAWTALLVDTVPNIEPDSWICGLGRAGEDLQPYLEDWLKSRVASAYEHLVRFIEWNQPAFVMRHCLTNSFWLDSPMASKQVCDWLTNVRTREELGKIYFASEAAVYAPALACAIERLELIAKV